jgi:hypothetical protein
VLLSLGAKRAMLVNFLLLSSLTEGLGVHFWKFLSVVGLSISLHNGGHCLIEIVLPHQLMSKLWRLSHEVPRMML